MEENEDPNLQMRTSKGETPQMFDEDYGMLKMEKFKQQCRNILGVKKDKHKGYYIGEGGEDQESEEDQPKIDHILLEDGKKYLLQKDYEATLDIISAYKNLKQAVSKPTTVHGGNGIIGSKGYLKMTIAATQHSKSKMTRDVLEYSLAQSKFIINFNFIRTSSCFPNSRRRSTTHHECRL